MALKLVTAKASLSQFLINLKGAVFSNTIETKCAFKTNQNCFFKFCFYWKLEKFEEKESFQ